MAITILRNRETNELFIDGIETHGFIFPYDGEPTKVNSFEEIKDTYEVLGNSNVSFFNWKQKERTFITHLKQTFIYRLPDDEYSRKITKFGTVEDVTNYGSNLPDATWLEGKAYHIKS